MLKGRYSLIHAERHLPRHSSEVLSSAVFSSFKSLTDSSMRQSLRFSVLHWPSPSSRNRGPPASLFARRPEFIYATTAVNCARQFRDISAWAQRPISNMPEKTGTRQATLGYVRDPQSTIWCVGLCCNSLKPVTVLTEYRERTGNSSDPTDKIPQMLRSAKPHCPLQTGTKEKRRLQVTKLQQKWQKTRTKMTWL